MLLFFFFIFLVRPRLSEFQENCKKKNLNGLFAKNYKQKSKNITYPWNFMAFPNIEMPLVSLKSIKFSTNIQVFSRKGQAHLNKKKN